MPPLKMHHLWLILIWAGFFLNHWHPSIVTHLYLPPLMMLQLHPAHLQGWTKWDELLLPMCTDLTWPPDPDLTMGNPGIYQIQDRGRGQRSMTFSTPVKSLLSQWQIPYGWKPATPTQSSRAARNLCGGHQAPGQATGDQRDDWGWGEG